MKKEKIISGEHFLALDKIAEKYCKHRQHTHMNNCLFFLINEYTDKYFISKEELKTAAKEFEEVLSISGMDAYEFAEHTKYPLRSIMFDFLKFLEKK